MPPAAWGEEEQRNDRAFGHRTEARDMKLVTTKGRTSCSSVLQALILHLHLLEHRSTWSGVLFCTSNAVLEATSAFGTFI